MEYYLVIERNELSNNKDIWKKCKCMALSERKQYENIVCYKILTIRHSGKDQNYRDSKNISGSHRFSSRGGMSKWNTADIFFK